MRWDFWLWMLAVAAGAGCTAGKPARSAPRATDYPGGVVAAPGPAPTKPPTVIVTPAAANVGKVTTVNTGARFVVVTFAVGPLPAAGRRLDVYRAGLKVGEIKVTGPSRDNNTVADIVAGECQAGDEVKGE